MKIYSKLIIMALIFQWNFVSGQLFTFNLNKINKKAAKWSKRNLTIREGVDFFDKVSFLKYSKTLNILPISSFILTLDAVHYDSSQSIINYLVLNRAEPVQEYYTLKNNNYEGVKSFFGDVYFNDKFQNTGYDSSKVFRSKNDYTYQMFKIYQELQKHNFEFVFAVKYFRNSIWFVEKGKVYLIDNKDFKVYNPDEYIKQKCSVDTIHNLSKNIINEFCD